MFQRIVLLALTATMAIAMAAEADQKSSSKPKPKPKTSSTSGAAAASRQSGKPAAQPRTLTSKPAPASTSPSASVVNGVVIPPGYGPRTQAPEAAAPARARETAATPAPAVSVDTTLNQPAAASASSKAGARITRVPDGAKEIAPNTHRYQDAQGKVWIYRQTPFGLTRYEEGSHKRDIAAKQPATEENVKVSEIGDSVRFERKGPFGNYVWTRKKTELDEKERALWESHAGGATSAPAAGQK
jgi:hypothetical protein